jgi:hypothetical protein
MFLAIVSLRLEFSFRIRLGIPRDCHFPLSSLHSERRSEVTGTGKLKVRELKSLSTAHKIER